MSKTLLIYERAVPVDQVRHRNAAVKVGRDFSFASDVNSMPLLGQEFRHAMREYPIVFAGTEENLMPAVLLGFAEHENLFVDHAGKWSAKYIPAFARRYPYVFSSNDGGRTLTLCVDEEFSGFSQEGEGRRLFDDNGEQTPYLEGVLDFQTEFQRLFQRTRAFCRNLCELNLLDPMRAHLKSGSGQETTIRGFMVVNRERLKQVPGERLSELVRVDELELLYLHLQSLHNVADLASRTNEAPSGEQGKRESTAAQPAENETPAVKKKKAPANKSAKKSSGG